MKCDVLIVGGGLGGCAAALTAAEAGLRVVLTEPTDWLGGQVTQQGVPPDENAWIEAGGCTRSYQRYRRAVRDYYRQWFPLTHAARSDPQLNPGGAWVSKLSHLPAVSVAVLEGMLAPHRASGRLRVMLHHAPRAVDVAGDRVESVTVQDVRDGKRTEVAARFVLDASEMGDLLELAGCEHVTGAEGRAAYGEPHGSDGPQPMNMQAVTWCFAMDFAAGEHVIDKPAEYDAWRGYVPPVTPAWPGPQLSWVYANPRTLAPTRSTIDARTPELMREGVVSLWSYRQVIDPSLFDPASPLSRTADPRHPGITIVNWPQNDYVDGPLFGCDDADVHWRRAKELSRCLFYWMQTEAERSDGGRGYPSLRLRGDVLGTDDGFAKHPYIREARRIRAQFTVTENHVGADARGGVGESQRFADSVGIGAYHCDLHPSTGGDSYIDFASYPFQIPLGALVPVRLTNLLPAAKNIGTTHLANGCYRLHPVEWNIGEAAAALAALCLAEGVAPQAVHASAERTADLQRRLAGLGVPLDWPAIRVPPTAGG